MTNKGQTKYYSKPISTTNQKYCNYRDKKKDSNFSLWQFFRFCFIYILIDKTEKYLKFQKKSSLQILMFCLDSPVTNGATSELHKKDFCFSLSFQIKYFEKLLAISGKSGPKHNKDIFQVRRYLNRIMTLIALGWSDQFNDWLCWRSN